MGALIRQYCIPALPVVRTARRRRSAAPDAVGGAADRVSLAGSGCSTTAARTAARPCSSAAMKRVVCGAAADPIERTRGRQSAKSTILGGSIRFFLFPEIAALVDSRSEETKPKAPHGATPCVASANSVHDQASVVGGDGGSVCGEPARERVRLCLVLVGFEEASFTTSESNPERMACPAVERSTSTFSSPSPTGDSAVMGVPAPSAFLRPRPSCFAKVDRRSVYAGAVSG
jgi:hypothetical protein